MCEREGEGLFRSTFATPTGRVQQNSWPASRSGICSDKTKRLRAMLLAHSEDSSSSIRAVMLLLVFFGVGRQAYYFCKFPG